MFRVVGTCGQWLFKRVRGRFNGEGLAERRQVNQRSSSTNVERVRAGICPTELPKERFADG